MIGDSFKGIAAGQQVSGLVIVQITINDLQLQFGVALMVIAAVIAALL